MKTFKHFVLTHAELFQQFGTTKNFKNTYYAFKPTFQYDTNDTLSVLVFCDWGMTKPKIVIFDPTNKDYADLDCTDFTPIDDPTAHVYLWDIPESSLLGEYGFFVDSYFPEAVVLTKEGRSFYHCTFTMDQLEEILSLKPAKKVSVKSLLSEDYDEAY